MSEKVSIEKFSESILVIVICLIVLIWQGGYVALQALGALGVYILIREWFTKFINEIAGDWFEK